MEEKVFISTSIPYLNAPEPHIGFGLEIIQADVLARYHRQKNKNVFFLTGSDENSLKSLIAAEKENLSPKELVERNSKSLKDLKKILNISFDDFIRTTEERHIKGAQKLWQACKKDIYKKNYKGLYCAGCEAFYLPKDLENGLCPEHKTKPEFIEEENYFFRLSRYADFIGKIIENDELRIAPEKRKNETLSFINPPAGGLEDFSISRSAEKTKGWGIPVPGDSSQTMWVWFDALSNYINALGYAEETQKFKDFWLNNKNILHVVGKGVARFHTIYWPAMLKSAGLPLPRKIFVHGYVTVNGEKMSKSLGNCVTPRELAEKYGTDAVRYFLLREIPSDEDGDYSEEKFVRRYNGDLANGLGNFTARILGLASKQKTIEGKIEREVEIKTKSVREKVEKDIEGFKFNAALETIWSLIAFGDKYINQSQLWQVQNPSRKLFNLIVILDNAADLLKSFLPETAEKITRSISAEQKGIFKVSKIPSLFPRL